MIPTTTPTNDAPFNFKVKHNWKKDSTLEKQDVFIVAIADEASKPAYYIAVEPPSSLLDDAGVGKYIGDVKVLAQDDSHTYDAKDNKFTPIPSPTEKKLAEG